MTVLVAIYVGTRRGEEYLKSSPRRSNPRVAITIRRPSQGGGEGSIGYRSPGESNVGRGRKVHLRQLSPAQCRKGVVTTHVVEQYRCIRLEPLRHSWD